MPRHIVTLSPRSFVLSRGRKQEAQRLVAERLRESFRPRYRPDGVVEIDFPKRSDRRAAKEQVAAELDKIAPEWRQLFKLYPTEDSLRSKGY